jgi:fatty-acid desaturase
VSRRLTSIAEEATAASIADPLAHDPLSADKMAADPFANVAESTLLTDQPAVKKRVKRRSAGGAEGRLAERRAAVRAQWRKGLDWPVVTWMVFVHAGALAAPFFFTWKAVGLALVLAWITGGLGICLSYHRMLTHGSFSTYRPIRLFLAWLGGLAGEGSALTWVAVHRKHHVHSDDEGDPHSPVDGAWWSHMLWMTPNRGKPYFQDLYQRYAPDLNKDPAMRFLHHTFLLWHWLLGMGLFAVGYFGWDLYTGISFVAWGLFVRMVWVLHVTWFVNSATHMWGYRNYETTDDSRNLWWVGLLAYGEGWHNNHHAFQRMARHGHRWWEFDMTYWAILVMERLGLAWDVVHDTPAHRRANGEELPAKAR